MTKPNPHHSDKKPDTSGSTTKEIIHGIDHSKSNVEKVQANEKIANRDHAIRSKDTVKPPTTDE
jgi:hypothetical protein